LTLRSGMKNKYNALLPVRQPGSLAEAAGVEVEEYYALTEPVPVNGDGWSGTSKIWAERLKVTDPANTRILATYGPSNGWLDDQPSVTSHTYGKGRVTMVGAWLDEAAQHKLLDQITLEAGVAPLLVTPPGVEARLRLTPSGEEIMILINHTRQEVEVLLPWQASDLLNNQAINGNLILPPYEVVLIKQEV
jgi:beta-galactosidase